MGNITSPSPYNHCITMLNKMSTLFLSLWRFMRFVLDSSCAFRTSRTFCSEATENQHIYDTSNTPPSELVLEGEVFYLIVCLGTYVYLFPDHSLIILQ